jgi:hypothetical protein
MTGPGDEAFRVEAVFRGADVRPDGFRPAGFSADALFIPRIVFPIRRATPPITPMSTLPRRSGGGFSFGRVGAARFARSILSSISATSFVVVLNGYPEPLRGINEAVDKQLLGIYLNDHLAGAMAAHEVARRCLHNNTQTALGVDLKRIVREIEEDRAALESVMERLGISKSPVKTVVGRVLGQAGRLKLNGRLLRYSPLSRLEELEALAAGVEAKKAMWVALKRIRDGGVDLGVDLDDLVSRAQRQKRLLERRRLEAAAQALES